MKYLESGASTPTKTDIMAELNTQDNGAKTAKPRSKKINARVDLTAMVDLAFLLITFFMLTTSLSKQHAMNLSMPDQKGNLHPWTRTAR